MTHSTIFPSMIHCASFDIMLHMHGDTLLQRITINQFLYTQVATLDTFPVRTNPQSGMASP